MRPSIIMMTMIELARVAAYTTQYDVKRHSCEFDCSFLWKSDTIPCCIRGYIVSAKLSFAAAATLTLVSSQASALNARTWISGKGSDAAGCGPIAAPCRTLQFAHDQTSAGGEIDVLDPAGYGALVITKAINVINEGVGVAGALATIGGNAITVNAAAADAVVLRGLAIEGAGFGANGVVFNSGGSLTIANCLVQGFAGASNTAGNGISLRHTSGTPSVFITGTTASNNGFVGVFYQPTGSGGGTLAIEHLTAAHNQYGVAVYTGSSTGQLSMSITRSTASNNTVLGFQVYGPSQGVNNLLASLDTLAASHNGKGIYLDGRASVYLTGNTALTNKSYDLEAGNSVTMVTSSNNHFRSTSSSGPVTLPPF